MITFASSVGSLAMRRSAPGLLRRLGFRNTLVWVGLLAHRCSPLFAAFRPSWPMPACTRCCSPGLRPVAAVHGLQHIAYADVPRRRMSGATSFYTTFQQMSLSLGIGDLRGRPGGIGRARRARDAATLRLHRRLPARGRGRAAGAARLHAAEAGCRQRVERAQAAAKPPRMTGVLSRNELRPLSRRMSCESLTVLTQP